jgi:hypothetical protein
MKLTARVLTVAAKVGKYIPRKRVKLCRDCKIEMEKALLGPFPIIVCLNHKDGVRGGGFWFYPAVMLAALIPGEGFTMMAYTDSYWKALWASLFGRKKVETQK